MNGKISIIVPIYNVQDYLGKCIESLINQTYKNIEIVLVNDGSNDDSGRICDYYSSIDKRIKVIHQKNGGVSSARNTGLKYSTGDYIGFVDPDDWVDNCMYEKLLEILIKNKSSISMCSYKYENENTELNVLKPNLIEQNLSSKELISKLFVANSFYYTILCNKLYRADLWNDIKFPEGYVHEDEAVIHIIYDRCKQLSSISNEFYHYRMVSSSITHTNQLIRKIDYANALSSRLNYLYSKNLIGSYGELLNKILYLLLSGFDGIKLNKTSSKKIRKIIWENMIKILKYDFTIRFKTSVIICFISPQLYFSVFR